MEHLTTFFYLIFEIEIQRKEMNFLRLKGVAERLLTCGLQAGRITLCTYEATEHFHPRVSRLEREALTLCIPHLQDPGFPRFRARVQVLGSAAQPQARNCGGGRQPAWDGEDSPRSPEAWNSP